MIVEYDCQVCGTHVRKQRSPANLLVPARYCSQRCNGLSRRGSGSGITPNCEFDCASCGTHCHVYRSPSAPTPRFCSVQCTGLAQRGADNPAYSGGRVLNTYGYALLLAPDHPNADPRGYVYEHRLVMEEATGRILTSTEVVHHKNRIRDDNRISNLQLFATHSDHLKQHRLEDSHGRL